MKLLAFHLGWGLALGAAAPSPELPVETFFRKPAFANLGFSPDGRALALLQSINGRMNLVVLDLATNTKTQLANFREEEVSAYTWVTKDRLAFVG